MVSSDDSKTRIKTVKFAIAEGHNIILEDEALKTRLLTWVCHIEATRRAYLIETEEAVASCNLTINLKITEACHSRLSKKLSHKCIFSANINLFHHFDDFHVFVRFWIDDYKSQVELEDRVNGNTLLTIFSPVFNV